MSKSSIFFATLLHRVRIPYSFGSSLALCLDPLSFRWFFDIVFKSPIFSTALRFCVWILFFFQWLSNIMSGSAYHFDSSLVSSLDSLSFQRLSDIVFESPIILMALQHRVRIFYHFGDSSTSCPDPLSFWRLSSMVFGSSIISAALRHYVQIPYCFDGSPASCPDPLSFRRLSGIVSKSPIFSMALRHCV